MLRTVLALTAALYATPAVADQLVQSWNGAGLQVSRPTTFAAPWELQWKSTGFLQIYLEDLHGQMIEIIANQIQGGESKSYVARTGTFLLKFNAVGPWTAKAVTVD